MSRNLKTTYGGGGFYLETAVNYTLSASNGRVQAFKFTTIDKKLFMPDARLLVPGHMFYIIIVAGSQSIDIVGNGDTGTIELSVAQYCNILQLTDNTTQRGNWIPWNEQIWHIDRNN